MADERRCQRCLKVKKNAVEDAEYSEDEERDSNLWNSYYWHYNQAWLYWWQQSNSLINWQEYVRMHKSMADQIWRISNEFSHQHHKECRFSNSSIRENSCLKRSCGPACDGEQKIKRNYDDYYYTLTDNNGLNSIDECLTDSDNPGQDIKEEENFELNEEFKRFLEVSEKHRQEREKEKFKEEKRNKSRKNQKADKDPDFNYFDASEQPLLATTEAPKQINKREKYEKIYGNNFDQILNLEAEMQLDFDKFCDKMKPSYWPNIPLKL